MERRIFFNDLDCNIHRLITDGSCLSEHEVYTIIYKSMYPLVDGNCSRLLIQQVKYLIISFMEGDTSAFFELKVDGRTYFKFSNDANLAMSFISMENTGDFLMTLMPAVEII